MTVQTTRFPNGFSVITVFRVTLNSCALGLWLHNGSRHQSPLQDGYAHLLEHLLFRNDALPMQFERMGGAINAHSGRELTALYGLVPQHDALELLRLFINELLHLRITESELATEIQVIARESAAILQSPGEILEQQSLAKIWPGQALGWPIGGRNPSAMALNINSLNDYLTQLRRGKRLAVVVVGALSHESVVAACSELAELPAGDELTARPVRFQPCPQPFVATYGDETQLLWLLPAPAATDDRYTALLVTEHILAGGLHSRFNRSLRQQHGWVYGVHSELEFYSDTTLWKIRLNCTTEQARICSERVAQLIEEFIEYGPTADEYETAKAYLTARLTLAKDDAMSTMQRLAREYFYLGHHPDDEDYQHRLEQLTPAQISAVAAAAWSTQRRR